MRLLYVFEGRLRVQVKPLVDVDDGFVLTTVEQRDQFEPPQVSWRLFGLSQAAIVVT